MCPVVNADGMSVHVSSELKRRCLSFMGPCERRDVVTGIIKTGTADSGLVNA